MKKVVLLFVAILVVLISCTHDPEELLPPYVQPTPPQTNSPVVFDLNAVPYPVLSTYHFFDSTMSDLEPVEGVLPFAPITPLFSDYAHKKRFVWMPSGVKAHYVSDSTVLAFDDGAVLIKCFYYDNVQPQNVRRIMETRMLFKRNGVWEAVTYKWNDEQTEAYLDLAGSFNPLD
ncbi:MAG TPA: hypothetical protein PK760_05530, partial [Flavobacteriales bacterium]|nr:hypothetical protein [Flavobacteriales bacterium]